MGGVSLLIELGVSLGGWSCVRGDGVVSGGMELCQEGWKLILMSLKL